MEPQIDINPFVEITWLKNRSHAVTLFRPKSIQAPTLTFGSILVAIWLPFGSLLLLLPNFESILAPFGTLLAPFGSLFGPGGSLLHSFGRFGALLVNCLFHFKLY